MSKDDLDINDFGGRRLSLSYHRSFENGLYGKYRAVAEKLQAGDRVLELGCHTGYFVAAMQDRGVEILGIDGDDEAVAYARQRGLPVLQADFDATDFPPRDLGEFDAIVIMDVLEHLRDPARLLRNLHSRLRAGGRLLITGPNVAYWAVRKNLLLGRWDYTDGGILDRTHLWFFTAKTWKSLVGDAGYRIVECRPAEGMLPLEHWMPRIWPIGLFVERCRSLAMRWLPGLFAIVFLIEACTDGQPWIAAEENGN